MQSLLDYNIYYRASIQVLTIKVYIFMVGPLTKHSPKYVQLQSSKHKN